VTSLLTPLQASEELPAALNNPFRDEVPPLAALAAKQLMQALRAGEIAPGLPTRVLYGADGGKMFGVLVVETPDRNVGFLKSFSGQLEHRWDIEGFVPPVFDRALRQATDLRGEAAVRGMTARVIAAKTSPEWMALLAEKGRLEVRQAEETGLRHEKARRRLERAAIEKELRRFERRFQALERLRRCVSRVASWELYDTYSFESASGRKVSLRALFAPLAPPSGTGDCAAPKLLIHAQRQSLRPLALAEFWWGAPPRGGGRAEGAFSPACREKCGVILPFLLEGLTVEP
jgi:tRNA pseudouridine32 synthase / 23S rRNA pseudouridine746 synthase